MIGEPSLVGPQPGHQKFVDNDEGSMPRDERRWLTTCCVMSVVGAVLGVVLTTSRDRLGLPSGVAIVMGVLAGVLFLSGSVISFFVMTRRNAARLAEAEDGLNNAGRRRVMRAIRHHDEVEAHLRDTALRMARQSAISAFWSIYQFAYLALLLAFLAVTQWWLLRLWWLALFLLTLSGAGYGIRSARSHRRPPAHGAAG
jgi:hypothetical protein